MNARVQHTRISAMWDGRCARWLQAGATPGSIRTKAPPRMRRPGNGPLPWPPQAWAFTVILRSR
jgi:hypothetical protein